MNIQTAHVVRANTGSADLRALLRFPMSKFYLICTSQLKLGRDHSRQEKSRRENFVIQKD